MTKPGANVRVKDEVVGNYGNEALVTSLWGEGKIIFAKGGAGYVLPDGALAMKFGWWRRQTAELRIEGRRLDAPAPPLRSYIPTGYGNSGFQSSALILPTPGC